MPHYYKKPASSAHKAASSFLNTAAVLLLCFAVICFATAFFFNLSKPGIQSYTFKPSAPEKAETLVVPKDNTVYRVEVFQSIGNLAANRDWSAVSIEVTSEEGDSIVNFGGEFWNASGYDDGYWSETKNRYTMKVTFPIAGTYLINCEAESSVTNFNGEITVRFLPKRGSATPFFILGILTFLGGIAMGYFSNAAAVNSSLSKLEFS